MTALWKTYEASQIHLNQYKIEGTSFTAMYSNAEMVYIPFYANLFIAVFES